MKGKLLSVRTFFYGRLRVTCTRCNGIGGHVEGGDFHECRGCGGEGEL